MEATEEKGGSLARGDRGSKKGGVKSKTQRNERGKNERNREGEEIEGEREMEH